MTALAIGAATSPPKPRPALDRHRDRDARVVGRREGDEPHVVEVACRSASRPCRSCRRRACPGAAAACPCRSCTTALHHRGHRAPRSSGFITVDCTARLDRVDRAAVAVDDAVGRCAAPSACRRWRPPPRPRHLQRRRPRACPGRSPCARRRRARSSARSAGRCSVLAARRHLVGAGSRAAACGRSRSGACTSPSCACRASRRPAPRRCSPSCVSAVVERDRPEGLAAVVVQRHAGDASRRCSPSTVESGVNSPAVDRRGRGHDLERRARRVAELRRAVDQRRVLVAALSAP